MVLKPACSRPEFGGVEDRNGHVVVAALDASHAAPDLVDRVRGGGPGECGHRQPADERRGPRSPGPPTPVDDRSSRRPARWRRPASPSARERRCPPPMRPPRAAEGQGRAVGSAGRWSAARATAGRNARVHNQYDIAVSPLPPSSTETPNVAASHGAPRLMTTKSNAAVVPHRRVDDRHPRRDRPAACAGRPLHLGVRGERSTRSTPRRRRSGMATPA